MQAALPLRDGQIDDLVRRAEAGEEVVLTRHGAPAIKLVAVVAETTRRPDDRDDRLAALLEISKRAAAKATPGPDAAHVSDYLFDEFGLPA